LKKSYLIVGVLNTCFSVTLFYLLLQILQCVQYQLILFICFVIANLQSHYTQRALVWKSTNPYFSELMRFFAGAIGMFVVNLVLLTLLVEILGYATFESQVSLTLLLTILNYFFQKHAVFKAS
jgi:putative flippase GtrA